MGSWYFGFYFTKEHTSDCWIARTVQQEKVFNFVSERYREGTEIRERCSFLTGDLILSTCFDPKFVTAFFEFIKLFLQKLFFLPQVGRGTITTFVVL